MSGIKIIIEGCTILVLMITILEKVVNLIELVITLLCICFIIEASESPRSVRGKIVLLHILL